MKTKNRQSSIVNRQCQGFTLNELLIALMVGVIVLTAAATLADAMSQGKAATEQMNRTANYLAHIQTRLADLVMSATVVAPVGSGVQLFYGDGRMVNLTSADSQRITIEENGETFAYIYDSAQSNVVISQHDGRYVIITFDITEDGRTQSYTMTATRRGGS